jgi:hypothetical protein
MKMELRKAAMKSLDAPLTLYMVRCQSLRKYIYIIEGAWGRAWGIIYSNSIRGNESLLMWHKQYLIPHSFFFFFLFSVKLDIH